MVDNDAEFMILAEKQAGKSWLQGIRQGFDEKRMAAELSMGLEVWP